MIVPRSHDRGGQLLPATAAWRQRGVRLRAWWPWTTAHAPTATRSRGRCNALRRVDAGPAPGRARSSRVPQDRRAERPPRDADVASSTALATPTGCPPAPRARVGATSSRAAATEREMTSRGPCGPHALGGGAHGSGSSRRRCSSARLAGARRRLSGALQPTCGRRHRAGHLAAAWCMRRDGRDWTSFAPDAAGASRDLPATWWQHAREWRRRRYFPPLIRRIPRAPPGRVLRVVVVASAGGPLAFDRGAALLRCRRTPPLAACDELRLLAACGSRGARSAAQVPAALRPRIAVITRLRTSSTCWPCSRAAPRLAGQCSTRGSARAPRRASPAMCSAETSDSRFSRSSGSVFEGRTLKCQSS